MKDYLFAYGTLANEQPPAEIAAAVRRLNHVGCGFVSGRLYDLGDYPGAILDRQAGGKIFGKLFELPSDERVLRELDLYEGFDPRQPGTSLFVRKRTTIRRPNRSTVNAWIYEYNGSVKARPLIDSIGSAPGLAR